MRRAALTLAATGLLLLQAAGVCAAGAVQDVPRAADATAPPAADEPESAVQVRIESVNTLSDYAAVTRLLQAIPGVRRVNVTLVDRASVSFDVGVRGGAEALEQALAGQPRLAREGTALAYRYQPAPAPSAQ